MHRCSRFGTGAGISLISADCYRLWNEAIRNQSAAQRRFAVALNLAEDRRGALFVVLDDAALVHQLISAEDLLRTDPSQAGDKSLVKRRFHYLLRDQDALRPSPSVLKSVARIDGAIVLDQDAHLLSFGAILQNSIAGASIPGEGSRDGLQPEQILLAEVERAALPREGPNPLKT